MVGWDAGGLGSGAGGISGAGESRAGEQTSTSAPSEGGLGSAGRAYSS